VGASAATVPLLDRAEPGNLALRILSALVLAPIAIAAAWFGSPWLSIVTAVAAAGMGWEWSRLCGGGRVSTAGWILIGAVLASIVAASLASVALAFAAAGAGAVVVFMMAARAQAPEPRLLALGLLWIAVPCVLLLWLECTDGAGRPVLLWIFAVVWATDVGAYLIGRQIGGPLLAPQWSPRKTWAGMIGGVGCAALAGWATAGLLGLSSALPLVLASAGLAIIEQFGDLAESVAKRRFGVKDSSGVIPGHGGLLDRLDGLLAVIPAVALLALLDGGSVLTWR